jgi:uncharacterized membrane protein
VASVDSGISTFRPVDSSTRQPLNFCTSGHTGPIIARTRHFRLPCDDDRAGNSVIQEEGRNLTTAESVFVLECPAASNFVAVGTKRHICRGLVVAVLEEACIPSSIKSVCSATRQVSKRCEFSCNAPVHIIHTTPAPVRQQKLPTRKVEVFSVHEIQSDSDGKPFCAEHSLQVRCSF